MQEKAGSEHESGASEKVFDFTPSRNVGKTLFWQVEQTLSSSVISSQRMKTCPN